MGKEVQALLKDAAESEHERHGLQGLVAELRRTLSTSEGKNCDLEEAVDLLGQEIISWKAKEEVWVEQKMEAEQAQYRAEGRATALKATLEANEEKRLELEERCQLLDAEMERWGEQHDERIKQLQLAAEEAAKQNTLIKQQAPPNPSENTAPHRAQRRPPAYPTDT